MNSFTGGLRLTARPLTITRAPRPSHRSAPASRATSSRTPKGSCSPWAREADSWPSTAMAPSKRSMSAATSPSRSAPMAASTSCTPTAISYPLRPARSARRTSIVASRSIVADTTGDLYKLYTTGALSVMPVGSTTWTPVLTNVKSVTPSAGGVNVLTNAGVDWQFLGTAGTRDSRAASGVHRRRDRHRRAERRP